MVSLPLFQGGYLSSNLSSSTINRVCGVMVAYNTVTVKVGVQIPHALQMEV